MSVTKNLSGTITITGIVSTMYIKKVYSGYTVKQAKDKFRTYYNEINRYFQKNGCLPF